MKYLLYLVGFIIALAVFLYFLSALESGKEKIKQLKNPEQKKDPPDVEVEPENIFMKRWKAHPGERICPLCGSVLTKYESLYASQQKTPSGPKILIHGCRYCYKQDEEK